MAMNPFTLKPKKIDASFRSFDKVFSKPYDKNQVSPYTKVRIILMNGTEFEANWFKHQLARHCTDNDIRREIALCRRVEQQQQKAIASLKPIDETILEHAIGYEQLAVDLTAIMAQNETDAVVKKALDFALLEDFDHLYRFADLLEMEQGVRAERLVGSYTEIMPGRPTVSEYRYPFDDIKPAIKNSKAMPLTKLNASIITAAEQQTMNYYMNLAVFHPTEIGRKLFSEIAMIEEQHVSQYESLNDSSATWLEMALLHEYAECYLYYSMYEDESDERVKKLWERHFEDELSHLHHAVTLLEKYQKKDREQVIPGGEFPELLSFEKNVNNNKEYIRSVIKNTVRNTAVMEDYAPVCKLPKDYQFFKYNDTVLGNVEKVASHKVIEEYIAKNGTDYRFEEKPHPTPELRNRKCDNTTVGRECAE